MEQDIATPTHSSKCDSCGDRCGKLEVFDWLSDLPDQSDGNDIVEIQFKNTRKGFYRNTSQTKLSKGDVVAVEASPGHDIGIVTLTGELVLLQMKKNNVSPSSYEFKRVYRKAKPLDLEKWEEAKGLEHETMLESRRIAWDLGLNMKIGDVEYQGDRTKAIFYYIADERVDFRALIKVLAERFKVRIEMRQIGARQEAGRIGGIGPCGRELCCSTWMTNFKSVTTNAARYQEISLNPQKLAGQCGKLKCCLNYELDAYLDAQKDFPNTAIPLETEDGTWYHFKTDVFKRLMWYSAGRENAGNIVTLTVDQVKEVQAQNKKGQRVKKLDDQTAVLAVPKENGYENVIGEESITRFDDKNKKSNRKKRKNRKPANRPQNQNEANKPEVQEERKSTPGRQGNARRRGPGRGGERRRREDNGPKTE
ncbi:PSP1 domain-containing protein [Geofilum rhodophaeum]|uniref:PSP1 domain-containing protein n=1 Tax=Geofilum rhodophaeum TaxID=1965019 RepID=UPI000B527ABA|nr:regulatory iron-sulfur-containing complex subunit RicT [Geofilum rhodophaeum]